MADYTSVEREQAFDFMAEYPGFGEMRSYAEALGTGQMAFTWRQMPAGTGGRGSYSYYTRPGDHLDLHVDVQRCDVTLITVLQDSTPRDEQGGALATWSNHIGAPLHSIRESAAPPTATIKVPRGSSVVLLGGILPHAVLPIGASGTRVISPLCFAAD